VTKSNDFCTISVYSKAAETKPIKTKISYSQEKQDLIILALMEANDAKFAAVKNNGRHYFVDLAANDANQLSISYLLLEKNNWEGICLEPNPVYLYCLASYRKCTIIGAMVSGTPQEDGKEVDVVFRGVFGEIVGKEVDNKKAGANVEKRNLVSISTIFQVNHVPNIIDYFSLDVEGAESIVMEDFP
jgi:hypothetical protein